jgi:ubiquinone/menaquinone biosynthesis C-methylase UbiE
MKELIIALISLSLLTASLYSSGLDADAYKKANKQEEWALDFFNTQVEMTGKEKRVLDLGSGDGAITAKIAQIYGERYTDASIEFTGIDISESMVESAKDKYPHISFELGSLEKIPYRNFFDLVLSFSTLHFSMDQEKALQEIYGSLRTEGRIAVLVPAKNGYNMNPLAGSLMVSPKWKSYFPSGYTPSRTYFTADEYQKMLAAIGFSLITIKMVEREDLFSSMEVFVDSLAAVLNYVPLKIRQEFASDLAPLLDISIDSSGQIHQNHTSLHITAIK